MKLLTALSAFALLSTPSAVIAHGIHGAPFGHGPHRPIDIRSPKIEYFCTAVTSGYYVWRVSSSGRKACDIIRSEAARSGQTVLHIDSGKLSRGKTQIYVKCNNGQQWNDTITKATGQSALNQINKSVTGRDCVLGNHY